jgi:hypothetical protein
MLKVIIKLNIIFFLLITNTSIIFAQTNNLKLFNSYEGEYYRWYDPSTERAFSVEVPVNWSISGGTKRISDIDIIQSVIVYSPDKSIILFIGKPPVGIRSVPIMPQWEGLHSNQIPYYNQIRPQYFESYKPAVVFLENLLPTFHNECLNPKILYKNNYQNEANQISQIMNQIFMGNIQFQLDLGMINASCDGGRTLSVIADTILAGAIGTANWMVPDMYGISATNNNLLIAYDIMNHMISSFKYDINWYAMQNKTTIESSRIQTDLQNHQSAIIAKTFEYKNQVHDKAMNDFSEYIRGVVTVEHNGVQKQVENKGNYVWRDPKTNAFISTETDTSPGVNFERWNKIK